MTKRNPPSLNRKKGIWMKNNGWKRKWLKNHRSPTGEKKTFEYIRNNRPRICVVTGVYFIPERAENYAHLLPKGMYPEYRNNPENIALVKDVEAHHKLDRMVTWNKLQIKALLDEWKSNEEIMDYLHNLQHNNK